jgi:hypothetical protein
MLPSFYYSALYTAVFICKYIATWILAMEMMNLKPNLTLLVDLITMPYVGLWLRKKKVYLISHVKKILGKAAEGLGTI